MLWTPWSEPEVLAWRPAAPLGLFSSAQVTLMTVGTRGCIRVARLFSEFRYHGFGVFADQFQRHDFLSKRSCVAAWPAFTVGGELPLDGKSWVGKNGTVSRTLGWWPNRGSRVFALGMCECSDLSITRSSCASKCVATKVIFSQTTLNFLKAMCSESSLFFFLPPFEIHFWPWLPLNDWWCACFNLK